MNRAIATLILTVSATLGVTSLQAQEAAVATIPFAFKVKSRTLPAGKYSVKNFTSTNRALFSLADFSGHSIFVGAHDQGVANPNDPKLTFACYGGKCSLATINLPGSSTSYSLPKSATHSIGMTSMISVRLAH